MRQTTRFPGGVRLAAALLAAAAASFPQEGVAQVSAAGTRLTVDVQVVEVSTAGGVTRIAYRLANRRASQEKVLAFVVDAPSPALDVALPAPEADWSAGTRFRARSVARWAVLGEALRPGTSGPLLRTSARGLPGLVRYWVRGDAPPPPVRPEVEGEGDVAPTSVLATGSVSGTTLGVVPAPRAATPAVLTRRLQGLLATVCAPGGMISDARACAELRPRLDDAVAALEGGSAAKARGALRAFAAAVTAQRGPESGRRIPDAAYWLLRANAEIIVEALH